MVFSSLLFIFAFLPIVLGVYYLLPSSCKNAFLILASLIFFAWGGVSYTIIIVASIVMNYSVGLQLERKNKFAFLVIGMFLNLGVLFYFKYLVFVITSLSPFLSSIGVNTPKFEAVLPIGISFYTFQAISYLIDVYQNKVSIQKRIDHLALYIMLFPQLIAGPIVRYHEIKDQIAFRSHTLHKFSSGIDRFAIGLGKKVLIANTLGQHAEYVFSMPIADLDPTTAWIGTILYAFQIYFDFSGYSDMAIGLGLMFGFKFPENFNFPYAASSIKDFWRRWHITLSAWFRDYLYIPIGGNRKGSRRTFVNLFIVFVFTGFWHGAAWSFLIWGLIHGSFIVLERTKFGQLLNGLPRFIGIIYTWFIVLVAWVFFKEEQVFDALDHLKSMFGAGAINTINKPFINQLSQIRPLLIIGIAFLFSTGIANSVYEKFLLLIKIFNTSIEKLLLSLVTICVALIPGILLVLCTIELNLNSFNPFIYFRF